ncbi:hypothetical protein DJ666_09205, partial [Campylobacter jejuni]|nr:hypothetical protein [Campylobacter jejuni]
MKQSNQEQVRAEQNRQRCGNFANFVGEDNIVFFPITTLLIVFTIAICAVWGLSNVLSLSLFIMPIFVA